MTLLILVTAAVSPILDNVTCVLLVAPVTLSVCRRLGLPPAPYLITLVLAVQHRRHGDAHRRPAEHHHRQPSRADLQRLPDPLAADHRRPARRVRAAGRLLFRHRLSSPSTPGAARRHPPARRDHRHAAAGALPGRAGARHGRLRAAHRAAPRPVDRGDARRRRDGRLVSRATPERVPRGGRVDHPGLLHGAVRPRRRPGRGRRHRRPGRARRRRDGRPRPARRHRAALRLRRGRRLRRQHPLHRCHGPDRRGHGRCRTRPRSRAARCGGRSCSAPTSAATPPPSPPARTWSYWASRPRPGQPISFWQFTSTAWS